MQAEPPSGVITFTYNADGQRVEKRTPSQTRKFLYDFKNLLLETDAADHTEKLYTSTVEEFGHLLSQYDGSDSDYYAFDGLGSTDRLTNPAQTSTAEYIYRAFGQIESKDGLVDNDFTFIGKQGYYQDPEIDLYLLRARYYDPTTGRFISEDPLGFESEDANLYRYTENNPTNATDPSGETPFESQLGTQMGKVDQAAQSFESAVSKLGAMLQDSSTSNEDFQKQLDRVDEAAEEFKKLWKSTAFLYLEYLNNCAFWWWIPAQMYDELEQKWQDIPTDLAQADPEFRRMLIKSLRDQAAAGGRISGNAAGGEIALQIVIWADTVASLATGIGALAKEAAKKGGREAAKFFAKELVKRHGEEIAELGLSLAESQGYDVSDLQQGLAAYQFIKSIREAGGCLGQEGRILGMAKKQPKKGKPNGGDPASSSSSSSPKPNKPEPNEPAPGTGRAGRLGIDLDELRPTSTVAGHAAERPYINSPHTIRNIIDSADPIPDPGGFPGALRWDVPGSFRGSAGTFELVIDPATNRILHFLFRSS